MLAAQFETARQIQDSVGPLPFMFGDIRTKKMVLSGVEQISQSLYATIVFGANENLWRPLPESSRQTLTNAYVDFGATVEQVRADVGTPWGTASENPGIRGNSLRMARISNNARHLAHLVLQEFPQGAADRIQPRNLAVMGRPRYKPLLPGRTIRSSLGGQKTTTKHCSPTASP